MERGIIVSYQAKGQDGCSPFYHGVSKWHSFSSLSKVMQLPSSTDLAAIVLQSTIQWGRIDHVSCESGNLWPELFCAILCSNMNSTVVWI